MLLVHLFVYLVCVNFRLFSLPPRLAMAGGCGTPWTFRLTYFFKRIHIKLLCHCLILQTFKGLNLKACHKSYLIRTILQLKQLIEKSRECHNQTPQPTPEEEEKKDRN